MTQMEALELALRLAIACPGEFTDKAWDIADQIAGVLTREEVETVQEELRCHFNLDAPAWGLRWKV